MSATFRRNLTNGFRRRGERSCPASEIDVSTPGKHAQFPTQAALTGVVLSFATVALANGTSSTAQVVAISMEAAGLTRSATSTQTFSTTTTLPSRRPDDQPYQRQPGPGASSNTAGVDEQGRLKFLLLLPYRPIVIVCQVVVDGRPFHMLREQRVDQILARVTDGRSQSAGEFESATTAGQTVDTESETAKPFSAQTLADRAMQYFITTKLEPSREEVRWLISRWTNGPTLMLLKDRFQRQRATRAPLFKVIDINGDGTLDANEQTRAVESLMDCDADGSESITLEEIETHGLAANPDNSDGNPSCLLAPFSTTSDHKRLAALLHTIYPESHLNAGDLMHHQPTLHVRVSFDTTSVQKSRIVVESDSADSNARSTPGATKVSGHADSRLPAAIVRRVGISRLEVSAVQTTRTATTAQQDEAGVANDTAINTDAPLADPVGGKPDQISVGLIDDGYPLFPEFDSDGNKCLTLRELRRIPALLLKFDGNGDGEITRSEVPSMFRLAIGLGPVVHAHLRSVRTSHPMPTRQRIPLPDWFAQMDKNDDGDLTRGEFLGTEKQFQRLDRNDDGLVSAQESAQARALIDPQPGKQ